MYGYDTISEPAQEVVSNNIIAVYNVTYTDVQEEPLDCVHHTAQSEG